MTTLYLKVYSFFVICSHPLNVTLKYEVVFFCSSQSVEIIATVDLEKQQIFKGLVDHFLKNTYTEILKGHLKNQLFLHIEKELLKLQFDSI